MHDCYIDDSMHCWVVLFAILSSSALVYLILMNIRFVPSIVVGINRRTSIAFVAEWVIYDLPAEAKSFKSFSIPFIVILSLQRQFLFAETAIYSSATNT